MANSSTVIGEYARYVTNNLPPRVVIDVALTANLSRYFNETNRGAFNDKNSARNENVWQPSIIHESATPTNVKIQRRVDNNSDVVIIYDTNICIACLGTSTRDRLRAIEHLLVFSTDEGARYACTIHASRQTFCSLDDEYDADSILFLERIRLAASEAFSTSMEHAVATRLVADIRRVFRFTSHIETNDYRRYGSVELIIIPETTTRWPSSLVDIVVPYDETDKLNYDNAEKIVSLVRYIDLGHEKIRGGVRVCRERAGLGQTLWSTRDDVSVHALTVAPIDTLRSLGLLARRLRPDSVGSIVAVEEIMRDIDWQSQQSVATAARLVIPREFRFYEDRITWHVAFLRFEFNKPLSCSKSAVSTQRVGIAFEAYTILGKSHGMIRISERSMTYGVTSVAIAPVNESWLRDGLNVAFEWDRNIVETRRNVRGGQRYLNLNVKIEGDDKGNRRYLLPLTDVSIRVYRARIVLDEQKTKCVTWIPCIGPSAETSIRDIDEFELSEYRSISETALSDGGAVANTVNRLWYVFEKFCQDIFGYNSSSVMITVDNRTMSKHMIRIEAAHPPFTHSIDDRSIRVVVVYECDLTQIEPSAVLIHR